MKHGARGKKQTLKSASTDLGTTDVGKLKCVKCVYIKQYSAAGNVTIADVLYDSGY